MKEIYKHRPYNPLKTSPRKLLKEQFSWKIAVQLPTLKSLVICKMSIIDERFHTFSDSLNHFLKNLEVTQNSSTDLLKENVECLKKKLNSKDKLIRSLIDTKTAILDTIGKSKRNAGKRHSQIEPSRF